MLRVLDLAFGEWSCGQPGCDYHARLPRLVLHFLVKWWRSGRHLLMDRRALAQFYVWWAVAEHCPRPLRWLIQRCIVAEARGRYPTRSF